MIYFITTFTALGILSAIIMGVALVCSRARFTKFARRSLLMAVVWLGAAALLHVLHVNTESFRRGLPVSILNLDLQHARYADIAITELTRRAESGVTGFEEWQATTQTLLENPWWTETTAASEATSSPTMHALVHDWFAYLITQFAIPRDQIIAWLELEPPPIFELSDSVESGPLAFVPVARFGREWQMQTSFPFEVARIEFLEVRIDGTAVNFNAVEAEGSEASIGRYAHLAMWMIEDLRKPDAPGTHTIEIDYTLDLEPGAITAVGPLTWRKDFEFNPKGKSATNSDN